MLLFTLTFITGFFIPLQRNAGTGKMFLDVLENKKILSEHLMKLELRLLLNEDFLLLFLYQ